MRGIEREMKAEFKHKQRMLHQKAAQLGGGAQALADTDEKGFEIGALRMAWAAPPRALSLPAFDERPIQRGKEGAVADDDGIIS